MSLGSPQHDALYNNCLTTVMNAAAGAMSRADAKQLLREAQNLVRNMQSTAGVSANQVLGQAAQSINVRLKAQAAGLRRAALDSATKAKRNQNIVSMLVAAKQRYGDAIANLIHGDRASPVAGAANGVEQIQKSLARSWESELIKELDAAGVRTAFIKAKHFKDVTKEMWVMHSNVTGGNVSSVTGNVEAFAIAKAIYRHYERSRAAYNLEGGMMGKEEFFVQTQRHDADATRRIGGTGADAKEKSKAQWVPMMLNYLDLQKTFPDLDMGDTRAITTALGKIHDNIVSGFHVQSGQASSLMSVPKTGSIAKQTEAERVLYFKGPDEFTAYNQMLGTESYNEALLSNISKMSRTVALMKVFGRNPEAGYKGLIRWAEGQVNQMKNGDESLKTSWLDKSWNVISGEVDKPASPRLYKVQRTFSNWMMSAKLGKIVLSALPDHATFNLVGQRIGAKRTDLITHQLLGLAPKGEDLARIAGEMGAGVDAILGVMADSLEPELRGNDWSGSLVRNMFKLTGANAWTKWHDEAFGILFAKTLGDASSHSLSAMPNKQLQRELTRYGITDSEWDFIRQQSRPVNGKTFLTVDAVRNAPDADWSAHFGTRAGADTEKVKLDVVTKFQGMVTDEVDAAILKPGSRERTVTTMGTQTGTPEGWAWRAVWSLKSYPLSMLNKVVLPQLRDIRMKKTVADKILGNDTLHMLEFAAYSTFLGMLSNTLSDLHAGKTPQDPFDEEGNLRRDVVMRGFMRGGGAGIYGDLLLTEYDKTYKNFTSSLAGPQIGLGSDLLALKTSAQQAAAGERSSVKGDALKLLMNNAPVANWLVVRPTLEYLFLNRVVEMLSPGATARKESRAEQNHQKVWLDQMELP